MRGEMGQDASQQRGFDFEVFGDGFNDPVALGEFGQVVVEVAGSDEGGERRLEEGGGLGFGERIEGGAGQLAARRFRALGARSSKSDRDAGVGQMRGDAGAHGSGAENGGAADEQRLSIKPWRGSCGCGSSDHLGRPFKL